MTEEQKLDLDIKRRHAELDLEAKKRELDERLPSRPASNPIHHSHGNDSPCSPQQPVYAQTVVVVQANGSIDGGKNFQTSIDFSKGYSSEWYDLLSDPGICCFSCVPCCIPFASVSLAHQIGAEDTHGVCGLLTTGAATICCCYSFFCCKGE